MNTGNVYKTKQRECILECIRKQADAYITIQQLSEALEQQHQKVGLTTIYRTLDKLEQEKAIAKISIDGVGGTCYRYLPRENDIFFSLKCERCGKVVDIGCPDCLICTAICPVSTTSASTRKKLCSTASARPAAAAMQRLDRKGEKP